MRIATRLRAVERAYRALDREATPPKPAELSASLEKAVDRELELEMTSFTKHVPVNGGDAHLQAYTVEQVAKMLHIGRDKVYYLLVPANYAASRSANPPHHRPAPSRLHRLTRRSPPR